MNLEELRKQMDSADAELLKQFERRMDVAAQIAEYKRDNGLPVLDAGRERQKLAELTGMAQEDKKQYVSVLYALLFELSRSAQQRLLNHGTALTAQIAAAIENTPKLFPTYPAVACQGVEGAYSQQACDKLFRTPSILYFHNFQGVFAAIDSGMCQYGVLPVENSTAGSVNEIYDLMMEYRFHIVRSTRLKVDHNLLAKAGVKVGNIRRIYSHAQAISQCAGFLKGLKNVEIIPCENTAAAAKMVAESDRTDIAALSSRNCCGLYGLECIAESVQDKGNNYTRFICIAKDLQIYPGADKTSIMMEIPNKPGALYQVLSRFYALDINLTKLESRPIPDRDFEFMFYFDLETPVYSPQLLQLLSELEQAGTRFRYLGSYSEIV